MRRLKETLVSTSLKLQLAGKLAEADATTIQSLRKELFESRKAASVSQKREEAASEIIQALRYEIAHLKRQVRDAKAESANSANIGHSNLQQEADQFVDQLMRRKDITYSPERLTSTSGGSSPTPFQQWKIENFLWAPDTPSASAYHDAEAVEQLMLAAIEQDKKNRKTPKQSSRGSRPGTTDITRPIQSIIAKRRSGRYQSSKPSTPLLPSVVSSSPLGLVSSRSADNREVSPSLQASPSNSSGKHPAAALRHAHSLFDTSTTSTSNSDARPRSTPAGVIV